MKRIVVVGTSGAGKTTLAKYLSEKLDLSFIWLDELAWLPGWKMMEQDKLAKIIDEKTSGDRWALDGNYYRYREIFWPKATHIIWLNYSFRVIFWRCLKRTIRRSWTKEKLFNGENRESFYQSFFTKHSILVWVLKTFWKHRREYPEMFKVDQYKYVKIIELKNQKELDEFLDQL